MWCEYKQHSDLIVGELYLFEVWPTGGKHPKYETGVLNTILIIGGRFDHDWGRITKFKNIQHLIE